MLPVFIWRAREKIFARPKRLLAISPEEACALGYFLELTGRLGRSHLARGVLHGLRRKTATVKDPIIFFHLMDASMLREFAKERTSPLARSWKLVLGEPDESFESYFRKAVNHAAL